jgi:hypothetical protein
MGALVRQHCLKMAIGERVECRAVTTMAFGRPATQ